MDFCTKGVDRYVVELWLRWFFPGLFVVALFVIFWLVVIFLVWGHGHRWGDHRSHRHWRDGEPAEEILADRFARGEIDEEEYNKRLSVLRKQGR